MGIAAALAIRLGIIGSLGAIFVVQSEYWFYPVGEEVGGIGVLIYYGLVAYLFVALLQRFKVRGRISLFMAAALAGILIEGVAVPVVYSALPFTIVWTSLAWHALLTICVGWFGIRVALHRGPGATSMVSLGYGAFIGAWNAYYWHVETSPAGELSWNWADPPEPFLTQLWLGYLAFLAGHVDWGMICRRAWRITFAEEGTLWVLSGAIFALTAIASGLWVFAPAVPLLVFACLWALSRLRQNAGPTLLDEMRAWQGGGAAYAATLLLPLAATGTYLLLSLNEIGIEMNAVTIFIAGPLSVMLWLIGFYRAFKSQKAAPQ